MNLPNSITIGRIAITPLIAWLPFVSASWPRLLAFALFILAAVTDYVDGMLARQRNLVTDLGRLLDPLADKLLLVATLVPMFLLVGSGDALPLSSPHVAPVATGLAGQLQRALADAPRAFPFLTPFGVLGIPWWVLVIVLGREFAMTLFRQAAARRGVVIGAIGPAKWKTLSQWIWVGAAYFWFFAATLAWEAGWSDGAWLAFAHFNGIVAVVSMAVAVVLTLYSLAIYVRRYGYVFRRGHRTA